MVLLLREGREKKGKRRGREGNGIGREREGREERGRKGRERERGGERDLAPQKKKSWRRHWLTSK